VERGPGATDPASVNQSGSEVQAERASAGKWPAGKQGFPDLVVGKGKHSAEDRMNKRFLPAAGFGSS